MKTVKQITKIKVKEQGLKGLEVTYLHPQEKDNFVWNNEHIEKRKHPIHTVLENHINELRNFVLEVNGYYANTENDKPTKDYLIEDCRIVSIEMKGSDRFKISAELRTIGDKYSKIPGVEVEEADGYEHFDTVLKIIKTIMEETHEYMAGKKKLEDHEFLTKFAKRKNDDVLMEEMKHMGKKELRDKCTEILEKMGGIVLIDEDADLGEVQMSFGDVEEEIEEVSEPVEININGAKATMTVTKVEEEIKIPIVQSNFAPVPQISNENYSTAPKLPSF